MSARTIVWALRVYAAGLVGVLGTLLSWEALGWWGVPFGVPLIGTLYALVTDSTPGPVGESE